MRTTKNNVLAGLFVVISLAGGVVMALVLANVSEWTASTNTYIVRFPLATGAAGLKTGSSVRVGGQEVGKVVSVYYSPSEDAPQDVDVKVRIRKAIPIHEDAAVELELPLLGSVSTLNIPNVGTPSKPRLADGSVIHGGLAPPSFLAATGWTEVQKTQLQSIMARMEKISGSVSEMVDKAGPAMDNLVASSANVHDVTSDVRAGVKRWAPQVDKVVDNIADASAKANENLRDTGEVIRNFKALIEANRPRIDAIAVNIQQITEHANGELMKSAISAAEKLNKSAGDLAEMADKAKTLLEQETPEIQLLVANTRLATDQLKLTMTEIRRNPWRIFYQPSKKEMEQELVYDAARSYASAVSDLRAVTASLTEVLASAKDAGTTPDAKTIADIKERVDKAFEKYKAAEDTFLKRLLADP